MKFLKKTIALMLCIILSASLLSGCSQEDKPIDFIYPFSGNIVSFDPQVASTSDEFLIVENCFEGLVRVLDDGTVQPGVAKDWRISDNGLTYTFTLRQGAKWNVQSNNPEKPTPAQELMGLDFNPDITANDFVFALQRAVDKNTNSPLFSSVANIVNAKEINSGKKSPDKLGVKAIDDYTLEIKLLSADDGFLNTLSTAVAMPCNEEYFYATKGRYGLGLKYSIFNGQFYVSQILDASYILKNNELYVGDFPSKIADITLSITDKNSDIPKNLKSGYYDSAYISGTEYEALNDDRITVQPYSNKMWAFVFNKNKQLFSSKELRQAVCLSISDADLSEYKYLSKATSFTPPSCMIGSQSADTAIGNTVPSQNTEKAEQLWIKGLEETGYSKADITIILTDDLENITKQLVQGIQGSIGKITNYGDDKKISFSLKLNVLSKQDFDKAFSKGDYDIAFYRFEASSQNAVSYLNDIINGNYAGEVTNVEKALSAAKTANAGNMADACKKCEQALMNDYSIMPILFESSYYAQAKGVSGVQFHAGSGRVSFVNATREK
ncbi:MAG: peptide ABC transporter substrate-binding protein [Eubacterium sp.]|nr:peptide ABC transporter substrate-binding protein [Eubacterium sp.]